MNSWLVHVWRRDPLYREIEQYPWDLNPLDRTEKKTVLGITKDSYTNLRHEHKGKACFSVTRSPGTPPVSSTQIGCPIEGIWLTDPNSFRSEHLKCRKRSKEEYDILIKRAEADLCGCWGCWAEELWQWDTSHSAQILSLGWDSLCGFSWDSPYWLWLPGTALLLSFPSWFINQLL